jgi:group I intron endonuclease
MKIMNSQIYGVIYKTYSDITGDTYIGQSTRSGTDLDYYLGSGKHLKRAIAKYGRDNFYKEIVCYCYTSEQLDRMERLYIALLRPEYNIALGGNTAGKHSEETKGKLREITKSHWTDKRKSEQSIRTKGRKASPETREKQRISHLGNKNHLGCKNSPEIIKKMSEAQKIADHSHMLGRKLSEDHKSKLSIAHTGKLASEETKHKNSIHARKLWDDAHEKGWATLSGEHYSEEFISKQRVSHSKSVVCIETGEIFESIKLAENKYHGNICGALKGKNHTAGGCHWKYYIPGIIVDNKEAI